MNSFNSIEELEIEPLSDDLLNSVAGASTNGVACCSCVACSNMPPQLPCETGSTTS